MFGSAASVAIAPEAATCAFGSSAEQKPVKSFTSVEEGSENLAGRGGGTGRKGEGGFPGVKPEKDGEKGDGLEWRVRTRLP
jgi:hypothetical protein